MAERDGNSELVARLVELGYADERTAKAMRKVDRADFVPKEMKNSAYMDSPLPIGHAQTISAPGVVALMTKLLEPGEGMKVLEVGSGSGYQAALLAELVGRNGKVITVERIGALLELAKTNCAKYKFKNLVFIEGDGSKGRPKEAPYDRIMVTASAPKVPEALAGQLKEGGRMVIPVGGVYYQDLLVIEKRANGELAIMPSIPVLFVPLIGEQGHQPRTD